MGERVGAPRSPEVGDQSDVVLKTNQEPALVDLVKRICAFRPSSRSCFTHSGDSKGCDSGLKGRKFVGHMLEFVSSVMFRVSGKVHGGVMQERWLPGIWLGKKLHTEGDGLVVRSRAVRENSQNLIMEDHDKLISTPHDPTCAVKTATMRTVLPEAHAQEKELGLYKPRPAKIMKNIIDKLAPTARWHEVPIHHPRRQRNGDSGALGSMPRADRGLMKAHQDFRERVDLADEGINKMLAEYCEEEGQGGK